jgi:hypothetical protein
MWLGLRLPVQLKLSFLISLMIKQNYVNNRVAVDSLQATRPPTLPYCNTIVSEVAAILKAIHASVDIVAAREKAVQKQSAQVHLARDQTAKRVVGAFLTVSPLSTSLSPGHATSPTPAW